jgi:hypothetical protein
MPFQVQDQVQEDKYDSYIQRLKDLEEVARILVLKCLCNSVENRVIVESEKVSDDNASTLSLKFHKNSNRDDIQVR